jgi:uncharacterized protein YfbU (UPF0304 family)
MAYIYDKKLGPEPEDGQESGSHQQAEPDWKAVVDAQRITLSEQYAEIIRLKADVNRYNGLQQTFRDKFFEVCLERDNRDLKIEQLEEHVRILKTAILESKNALKNMTAWDHLQNAYDATE